MSDARAPLSVVIPTLNAAASLAPLLAPLAEGAAAGLVREVVIADGGSDDDIAALAEGVGARFVAAPRGRGRQLSAGCAAAGGPWLLILHADTRLPADWQGAVADHIEHHGGAAAYFRLRFDDRSAPARFVAGWANLRSRLFGLPYGDQGLLVPRPLYDRAGGYPEIALMEDVVLVDAIRRTAGRGALRSLATTVETSAERYRRDGWVKRGARNLLTLLRWRLGADPEALAAAYEGRGRGLGQGQGRGGA
ncbi:MAG: TIGR04283 family arsenosugar biosynthesis glycosyltransferase [Pseudomonadota bacterium]